MATYKGIQGYSVKNLSSDPTTTENIGRLWYNSGSGKFKIAVQGPGTWSSGTNCPTLLIASYGAGTKTAGLIYGGYTTGPSPNQTATFEYDGSTWTTGGALNTGRQSGASTGTQTAGLCMGGSVGPGPGGVNGSVEEYNGASWSTETSLTASRGSGSGIGTTTAAQCAGGGTPANGAFTEVEFWNGTGWTEGADMSTGRRAAGGFGMEFQLHQELVGVSLNQEVLLQIRPKFTMEQAGQK
jgi:hypothetical protein